MSSRVVYYRLPNSTAPRVIARVPVRELLEPVRAQAPRERAPVLPWGLQAPEREPGQALVQGPGAPWPQLLRP